MPAALKVMALILRVNVNPNLVRKIKLSSLPESVEHLHNELKAKLGLEDEFIIQYEDPEFDNSPTNLVDISELPSERAVLHLVWNCTSAPEPQTSSDTGSISSLDTASLSSTSSYSPSSIIQNYMRSVSQWPHPFPIPSFSYDIELKLRKGNELYNKTGACLDVTREMKIGILDKLAQEIFSVKAYPEKNEIASVASALVLKHPCLTDPGNGSGYSSWEDSIKFKLGNYRSKLRAAGCNEVSVNRKRGREDDSDTSRFTLKKPRRGEVNFVPQHPETYDDDTLEEQRCILVDEMKKKGKDMPLIKQKMDLTFSLRRKEIVELQPLVMEVQLRWPALFLEDEICAEFKRITTKDLMETLMTALDTYSTRLIRLFRTRKQAFSKEMDRLLQRFDDQVSNIVQHRRTISLEGLPIFVRDSENKLFVTCVDTDPVESSIKGVKVGILTVLEDDVGPASVPTVVNIAVVLEEDIILADLPDLPTAFAYLFGLLYGLNMEFPKDLKYTFETVQHIFMELTPTCSKRVRSLKTKLLM